MARESLNTFLNLASRDDFVLIVARLLATLRSGSRPVRQAVSRNKFGACCSVGEEIRAEN